MALAPHLGRETEVVALGKTWHLARWDRGVWEAFLEWARTQLADPIEVASRHLDKLPPKAQEAIVTKALEIATGFLSIGSPRVNELLSSPEGGCELLRILLKKHHPDVTPDDAMNIAFEFGLQEMQKKFDEAAGVLPESRGNGAGPDIAHPGPFNPLTGGGLTDSLSASGISVLGS